MRVLAIGAHGDDLEMFCGGTLARFTARGDTVVMCVVTDGRGRPKGDPQAIAQIRQQEAAASAALIGATPHWMGLPDGDVWFDTATRHLFIEIIRQYIPDLIITHPQDDYHPDHKATSRLVLDAVQIARTANYASQYAPHRAQLPIAFMEAERGIGFIPTEYVDIDATWQTKLAMLSCHRSQLMPGAYDPDFVLPPSDSNPFHQYARALSAFRGLAVSCTYAEGFTFWQAANRLTTRRVLP